MDSCKVIYSKVLIMFSSQNFRSFRRRFFKSIFGDPPQVLKQQHGILSLHFSRPTFSDGYTVCMRDGGLYNICSVHCGTVVAFTYISGQQSFSLGWVAFARAQMRARSAGEATFQPPSVGYTAVTLDWKILLSSSMLYGIYRLLFRLAPFWSLENGWPFAWHSATTSLKRD